MQKVNLRSVLDGNVYSFPFNGGNADGTPTSRTAALEACAKKHVHLETGKIVDEKSGAVGTEIVPLYYSVDSSPIGKISVRKWTEHEDELHRRFALTAAERRKENLARPISMLPTAATVAEMATKNAAAAQSMSAVSGAAGKDAVAPKVDENPSTKGEKSEKDDKGEKAAEKKK